jgi:DNA-binding transcriptional LysR family regulator
MRFRMEKKPVVDWDDFRNFLAIARHGTLSAAARSLEVRQSTMGRRLAAFEERAGVLLLQKTPRGFVLTPAGEVAFAEAEKMEAAALAATRAITGRDVRLEGEIRLTTVETLAAELLTPILAKFADIYPGITVKLITGNPTLSLASREADLSLRLARPSGGDLVIRKLGDMGFGFYASANYVAKHDPATPDGTGHRLILMADESATLPEMMALARQFSQADVALRSDSRYVQLAACKAGMGIACLAHYLADNSGLVCLANCEADREVWLVQHRDTQHMPRFKVLSAALSTGLKLGARQIAGTLN